MRRIRDRGENESPQNFVDAWECFSYGKHSRVNINEFEADLEKNLEELRKQLIEESWFPKGYTRKVIYEKKERILAKAPISDHVIEAAALLPYEQMFYDHITWHAPAVRPGMGNHALFKCLRNELFSNSQEECYYYFEIDAHHYFPLMDHNLLKAAIDRKVKPGKLRTHLFKVVDSYLQGVPLGIKTAQIFGQVYLAKFDRDALALFGIIDDPEKMNYWSSRYVTDRICTARTKDDYEVLCRGPAYMADLFRQYAAEGLKHYSRFVDNIIVRHKDKTFLHIVLEMFTMVLSRDYHITLNKGYNIRPTYMGIKVCGYVFFHDHVEVTKENKKKLAKHVARLRKRGHDEVYIRIHCASQFGYIQHADTINLIKTLGMEKSLGKIIKRRRVTVPFEGMNERQKVKFSDVISPEGSGTPGKNGGVKNEIKILLLDYKVMESKINKQKVKTTVDNSDGEPVVIDGVEPEPVLAIRFKIIEKVVPGDGEEEFYQCQKEVDKDGNTTKNDAQYYCYTGSKVLIDQAQSDFTKEDLPCPTIIREFINKSNQKYYRFT